MNNFPKNISFLSTERIVEGGASSRNFQNFNLALHVNDNEENVISNRSILTARYNLPSEPV